MTTRMLDVQRHGATARVFLNRPDVRNAFNQALIAEMTETFEAISCDTSLRAVVLGGHGKAFCAGADLGWMKAMADYTWADNHADADKLAAMLWTLWTCPVPVIGRVHGDCYAGGVGLAACCDVLVAAQGVNFCLSEARLGLLPATIAPYVLRAMGEQAARRYFVTAERFDADAARAMGMVHQVTAPEALDAAVDAVVAAVVAGGRQSLQNAGQGRGRSSDRCRPAFRHCAPHRRHPRQRRRARRRRQLPEQTRAVMAGGPVK